MPAFDNVTAPLQSTDDASLEQAAVQFPPVTRDHILNCSYDAWFPKYRTSCLKSRIIKLSPEFVGYLREDGITLTDEAEDDEEDWEPSIPTGVFRAAQPELGHDQAGTESDSDDEDHDQQKPARLPPNRRFPELHQKIKDEISQLGGEVVPKLNWSSPKDATWIMLDKNTMRCTSPDDVYLLLKSSSFISHDLEHAFDGCTTAPQQQQQPARGNDPSSGTSTLGFQPVLVLRPYFKPQPSLEFRCFVKQRNLVAISQRDLKNYDFLHSLRPAIIARVRQLFNKVLRFTFPDGSFVFDVYIPEGDDDYDETDCRLSRARLIDINPWAPRTDSLLFGWDELLELRVPRPIFGTSEGVDGALFENPSETDETTDDEEEEDFEPELRLVGKDDPIESNFLSSQYSAHKLPKDVVDASAAGEGGMREFAQQWNQMLGARNGGG